MTKATRIRRRKPRSLTAIRQQILDAAQPIVTAIIKGAKSGNYLQAKFLFDFAGISAAGGEAAPPSLAETLLLALEPRCKDELEPCEFRRIGAEEKA